MDVVMIALQHVEPARQTRIGGLEDREIVQVLDLMMNVELIQHELQPRHELTRELGGWKLPCPEVPRDVLQSPQTAPGTSHGATARSAPWRPGSDGRPIARADNG